MRGCKNKTSQHSTAWITPFRAIPTTPNQLLFKSSQFRESVWIACLTHKARKEMLITLLLPLVLCICFALRCFHFMWVIWQPSLSVYLYSYSSSSTSSISFLIFYYLILVSLLDIFFYFHVQYLFWDSLFIHSFLKHVHTILFCY